jgi:hypothetical protein
MSEFHDDDLTVEHEGDSELVKSLRTQLRNSHRERDAFRKERDDALKTVRTASVSDLVKGKGLDPDVAKYAPESVNDEATLNEWLEGDGKLFSKMLAPAPEQAPVTPEAGGTPALVEGEPHPALAALQQIQATEGAGWNPQLAAGEAAQIRALQDLSKQNLGIDGVMAAFQSGKLEASVASS